MVRRILNKTSTFSYSSENTKNQCSVSTQNKIRHVFEGALIGVIFIKLLSLNITYMHRSLFMYCKFHASKPKVQGFWGLANCRSMLITCKTLSRGFPKKSRVQQQTGYDIGPILF